MVMANLDYDLPLNLWWQGTFPEDADSPLWQRVDRLIFDSSLWEDQNEALHRLALIRERFGARLTLADLNWTRTLGLRQAAAQCFDQRVLLENISKISTLEIRHSPGTRLTALLLASWFAAQFSWMVAEVEPDGIQFRTQSGDTVHCSFLTGLGESVAGLTVKAGDCFLSIEREAGSGLLHSVTKSQSGTEHAHYAGGNHDLLFLLSEEMTPGNKHRVYLKALTILEVLLP
jgi:glucose-6-phosphate dehydrogenase assembly protein OpcA